MNTKLRLIINLLLNIVLLIIILYVYIIKVSDYDSFTLISNLYDVRISIENDSSTYYLLPRKKKELFHFKYSCGNHFFNALTIKNDTLILKNIEYSSLVLVKKKANEEKFIMHYDEDSRLYKLKSINSSFTLLDYLLSIVLKSILIFSLILIPLVGFNFLFLHATKFFRLSIAISIILTILSVYGGIYGLFIINGIQLLINVN